MAGEEIKIDDFFTNRYILSYGLVNKWNIIFSYFWMFLLFLIIINIYLQVLSKINKGTNKKFYNLFQLLYGDTNNMFSNRSEDLDPLIQSNIQILDSSINLVENDLGNNEENKETGIHLKVNNLDNDIYSKNFNQMLEYYDASLNLQNDLDNFNETISHLNEVQTKNEKTLKNLYITYSVRIKNYVDSLISSLDLLKYQINLAYVTPNIQLLINPLTKAYNSIYNSLINNKDFIKDYYKTFNLEDIKPLKLEVDGVQDLSADFKQSNDTFQRMNMN